MRPTTHDFKLREYQPIRQSTGRVMELSPLHEGGDYGMRDNSEIGSWYSRNLPILYCHAVVPSVRRIALMV